MRIAFLLRGRWKYSRGSSPKAIMKKQATIITESCCVADHSVYTRYAFRETVGECAKNGAVKSSNSARALVSGMACRIS